MEIGWTSTQLSNSWESIEETNGAQHWHNVLDYNKRNYDEIWKNLWKPVSTKFASRGIKSLYCFLKIKKLKTSYMSVKFFFKDK